MESDVALFLTPDLTVVGIHRWERYSSDIGPLIYDQQAEEDRHRLLQQEGGDGSACVRVRHHLSHGQALLASISCEQAI